MLGADNQEVLSQDTTGSSIGRSHIPSLLKLDALKPPISIQTLKAESPALIVNITLDHAHIVPDIGLYIHLQSYPVVGLIEGRTMESLLLLA